ncbi:unnamed protein product [Cylicocyclus nassatus]|uniref:C-type lectin domain-containing protein n=1 Tax=Cylicocyclus nassatus TaxID=53992 RepID=A0AA36GZY0_CYLNA|nr:unnamed protein product [Cylicocyclus nassatus]
MLLILLAIFSQIVAGQQMPDEEQMTQEFTHSKSVRETYEAKARTEVANVVNIAASPPEIQFDTSHTNIQLKPEVANVIPQTIIQRIDNGATVLVEEPRPDIYLVSQPINRNYMGSADSTVKLDKKNMLDEAVRVSAPKKSQPTKKPLPKKTTKRTTQKPVQKKTTKRPARISVHTKIVKKSKKVSYPAEVKLIKNLKVKVKSKSKVKIHGRHRVRGHVKHNKKPAKNPAKGKVPLNIRIEEHTKIDVLDGAKSPTHSVSQPINVGNPVRPVNVNVNIDIKPRSRPHMHPHRESMGPYISHAIHNGMRHTAYRHMHSHRLNKRPMYSRMRHIALRKYTSRRKSTRYTTRRRITPRPITRKPTNAGLKYDVWLKFGGCEYMVKMNAKNYDAAEATCRRHGAHLVSIHSEAENNFIHKITSTGSRVTSFEEFVWIGLRINSKNEWEWIDGSILNYKKWAIEQPDHPGSEKCGQFHQGPASLQFVQDYYWNSLACERPMKYYVCKKCKALHHHQKNMAHHHHRCHCCCSCHVHCGDPCCKNKCNKAHKHERKPAPATPAQPNKPPHQVAVFPGQAE